MTDILNRGGPLGNIDVVVFPSALHLTAVAAKLRGDIAVGSQNVHCARGFGAFTGEHTPELLADSGIRTVLVGHSERRHIVGECEALCGEKARVALAAGFTVVFCVGETLADREKGKTVGDSRPSSPCAPLCCHVRVAIIVLLVAAARACTLCHRCFCVLVYSGCVLGGKGGIQSVLCVETHATS